MFTKQLGINCGTNGDDFDIKGVVADVCFCPFARRNMVETVWSFREHLNGGMLRSHRAGGVRLKAEEVIAAGIEQPLMHGDARLRFVLHPNGEILQAPIRGCGDSIDVCKSAIR